MIITTESGAMYVVRDGLVSRLSERPIIGYDQVLRNEPCSYSQLPEEGLPWRFHTEAGVFHTSRVVVVVE